MRQRPQTMSTGAVRVVRSNDVNQTKRLIVALPLAEYRQLADVAALEVREPEQQATYLIRRALAGQTPKEGVPMS